MTADNVMNVMQYLSGLVTFDVYCDTTTTTTTTATVTVTATAIATSDIDF